DPLEVEKMKEYAQNVLRGALKKNDLSLIGREEEQNNIGKVKYETDTDFTFINDLSSETAKAVKTLKPGEIYSKLIESSGDEYEAVTGGQIRKKEGVYIVKLVEEKEALKYDKQVYVSHILIAYKGAQNADSKITRTQDDAYKSAKEILAKAKAGENFSDLAKTYSDDPGSASKGGVLADPVNKNAQYVQVFKDNALKLENANEISDIVSSEFGYHIIKATDIQKNVKEKQVKLEKIFFSTAPDMWKGTGLTGLHFTHADVNFDQLYQPYISIQFNPDGAKLFEEVTGRNVNKPVAIFVGGEMISAPNVKEKISGGSAQITGRFTVEEANNLARDLNTGAIPAPVLLVGQHTIGSTIGQDALDKSVKAGLIGLLAVAIFMLLYYRLPGALAVCALSIYSLILLFLIKSEIHLIIAFAISAIIFAAVVYKILKAQEPTLEKILSFILGCFLLFFIAFLLRTPVTLTLAGVAGVILSIGMAVDANILIFERMKEELRAGKPLAAAVEAGFDRAWSSIRDSNYSSLLTCAILFYLGSSIIKGFAFNLAAGIIVSMFTAITITKTFLKAFVGTRWGQKLWLFGVKENAQERKTINFMKASPIFLTVSSIVIAVGVIAALLFGFKPGLDFTGGTLMELKFNKAVTVEELKTTLADIEKSIVGEKKDFPAAETRANTISATPEEQIDLVNSQIVSSGENTFIIKTKYLSNETHEKILISLKEKLGAAEELRFTTIGSVVGKSMQQRAIMAIIAACLMIAFYLAFAFRKIPKHVNPWRFGVAAVIALIHDVWITVAIFIVLGRFFNFEMDVMFITALLTVLGFSVHDTIVVYDRLREHLRIDERADIKDLTNISMTQTLTRSINTSLTTVITLSALLFFGSSSIFYFVLTLIIGIIVGTYSSIFIATPIVVYWTKWREKRFEAK
ncbi:protein translocase subunit SecF, partial [Candidatus Peregrinibacteria bacterium]|nr:protein translocase subunit SecF [Candidatus Peregrinibacteria bacterium]